jgi:hypothetical protein
MVVLGGEKEFSMGWPFAEEDEVPKAGYFPCQ